MATDDPFADLDDAETLAPPPPIGVPAPPPDGGTEGEAASADVDPLLEGLTDPQKRAVEHVDGPLLVLAGPGSGKTRVITRRIAHLVQRAGVPPWHVLAITFTNKAAGEMRERVGSLLSERQARAATVSTFHALCARLLRTHGEALGLQPGYSIFDTADQKAAIKAALTELEINPKNFSPASMLSTISNAKNDLVDADAYSRNASDFYSRTAAQVYLKYQQILERNQALDFDDLLLKTVELMGVADVRQQLRERYQYVLVDEYQDTNRAQFRIAFGLTHPSLDPDPDTAPANLMVTGDPDQSIYGWRGANIGNILDFETHYPNAETVRLEQNYRSTQTILAAADSLIANNGARKHKRLWTENAKGQPVRVVKAPDERAEAEAVLERFKELNEIEGVPWSQMAVFYRMNSLSRVMEDTLRNGGVPYQIARGTAFYDRKEIKDAVAFLRVVVNPSDEVNLFRVINTPARGISAATVKTLRQYALRENEPVDVMLADPTRLHSLNNRAQNALARFHTLVRNWRQTVGFEGLASSAQVDANPLGFGDAGAGSGSSPDTDPDGTPTLGLFVEQVMTESGLADALQNDRSDPDQERYANLGEFITSAKQFEEEYLTDRIEDLDPEHPDFRAQAERAASAATLKELLLAFLERISLVADADAIKSDEGTVTMMTLHAAKGLEYPAVAMIGVEDGMLPHSRAQDSEDELEEERRLAFVGITRAERYLMLSHARVRTTFGQTMPTVASRFLQELPEEHLQRVEIEGDDDGLSYGRRGRGGRSGGGRRNLAASLAQRSLAQTSADAFGPGTEVNHPQFGRGTIAAATAMGAHTRVKVDFHSGASKTLILEYAKLERV